jgi:transposase
MRLTIKKDQLVDQLVADYLAAGGTIQREAAQNVTKTLRRGLSLGTRHIRQYNKIGRRVVK